MSHRPKQVLAGPYPPVPSPPPPPKTVLEAVWQLAYGDRGVIDRDALIEYIEDELPDELCPVPDEPDSKVSEELEQLRARIEQVEALMVLYRNEGKLRDAMVAQEVLGILRGTKS